MKFIKLGIRHNLLYPLMMIIFTFFRKLDSLFMSYYIDFNGSLLLTLIMFLSEAITGLFFFIRFLKNISKGEKTKLSQDLIYNSSKRIIVKIPDSCLKIYLLIFFAAFFDFNVFIIQTFYFPKFAEDSTSFDIRVRSILTISNGLFCYYLLRLEIFKHQKLSLFIIFSSLFIVIITELLFAIISKDDIVNFFIILLLMILNYLFNSFLDIIEKYLIEFDNVNIFQLIMLEGFFGFLVTSIYSLAENPFKETKRVYNNSKIEHFVLLIICLIIYLITSGGRNIYRLAINKYYSPMARTLTDSFLDPLFIIYYFFIKKELQYSDGRIYFFIINLLLSVIIVFCGCVYNELFILLFCDLGDETYCQISNRALKIDEIFELPDFEEEEEENIENNEQNKLNKFYNSFTKTTNY